MLQNKKIIRTRFAPSPTGYLHIGGARTALYSWLYARKHNGVFILRIEDTDRARSTQESIQAILDGMEWLRLDYDEGPYFQSQRFDRYKTVCQQLLSNGKAYRCYCSKERLEKLRAEQMTKKQKPRYDGHCRDLNRKDSNEPFVIRFRNPREGKVIFHDAVRGTITMDNHELDDLIIARADGVPTYNFTVVVDDWDMQITHVIRGDDHINNTPRQINILQALGATLPVYAHVPMILGSDGKRLSKRHGAMSVLQYRDEGYLPEALLNYLVRLGWAHGDQEIFSHEERIRLFSLKNISRSPAAFNPEKLAWINQYYMKTLDLAVIVKPFAEQLTKLDISYDKGPALEDVIVIQAERTKTLAEMALRSRFFYSDVIIYEEEAAKKNLKPEIISALLDVRQCIARLNTWNKEELHHVIIKVAKKHQLKLGKLAQPIRVAVTGGVVSPPIDVTLYLIGRERVLARLDKVIHYIESRITSTAKTRQ